MITKPLDFVDPERTKKRLLRWLDTTEEGSCWTFTGATDKTSGGYGAFAVKCHTGGTRYGWSSAKPHRVMWALERGPIPDGMVIDHLCKNRLCCNPAHLEVVTQGVNALRSNPAPSDACRVCGGTDWIRNQKSRRCRPCSNDYRRRWEKAGQSPITCPECGTRFTRTRENMRFCGVECRRTATLRRRREWAYAKAHGAPRSPDSSA